VPEKVVAAPVWLVIVMPAPPLVNDQAYVYGGYPPEGEAVQAGVVALAEATITDTLLGDSDTAGRLARVMDTGNAATPVSPSESVTVQSKVPVAVLPAGILLPVNAVVALVGESI
jgi:hypothetical protein